MPMNKTGEYEKFKKINMVFQLNLAAEVDKKVMEAPLSTVLMIFTIYRIKLQKNHSV